MKKDLLNSRPLYQRKKKKHTVFLTEAIENYPDFDHK